MSQDRCNTYDFGVFLAVWNASQNLKTPRIHFRIANWLQKCWARGHRRLLLLAFRASGKSTLAGLYIAWMLCNNPDLRILVLSAESKLAEKMVRTIRKVIEKHPMAAGIRPHKPDQWAADSIIVQRLSVSRDPSVLARGLFANITGARADIIICDDVEVPNTCDTPDKRQKLRERLRENDFILSPGGIVLYLGTPHHYQTIYTDTPRTELGEDDIFLKDYHRLVIPVIDNEGESAWPERYKAEDVDRLRQSAGASGFSAQMMLKPVDTRDSRLDPALLHRFEGVLDYQEAQKQPVLKLCGRRMVSASAWWDPALGKLGSDGSVVAVVYTDEEGLRWLYRVDYLRIDPGLNLDEATQQCRMVCDIARACYLPSITVETNGIGNFLPAILRREMGNAHIPCAVNAVSSRKAKDSRILEAFETLMAARMLYVHHQVYATRFITELSEWRPGLSGAKDDALDAVAGALDQAPVRLRRTTFFVSRPSWMGQGTSHNAQTDFEV